MHLTFATGVTPNFAPRAAALWPSIRQHAIPFRVFLVDHPPRGSADHAGLDVRRVCYADVRQPVPKTQLQHGAFTQFWDGAEDDIVGFVDADARFQRAPTAAELAFLRPGPDEFMAGRNHPDERQTLADEARCLSPRLPPAELARLWPGHEAMLCRNFGFVVARVATWRRIYTAVCHRWADTARSFLNPAMVQWAALFAAFDQGMLMTPLPLTIHTHGHLGIPPGVKRGADGVWRADGQVILYAHALA